MVEKAQKICQAVFTYSFYLLFAIVPLAFSPFNHELFEFNKMWLTYILTIVIMASWLVKMVLQGEIRIQKTPLDIPIALFLISQIISTIFSIDIHTSLWGYYSRFNGGLLSIVSYILLYYALVSNFTAGVVKRLLLISLITGALVAFYGVLEHFGIDKDYWVQDVQNRVFSTLGQPNWLAAYLSILIPLALAFGMENSKHEARNSKQILNEAKLAPSGAKSINSKRFEYLNFKNWNLFSICNLGFVILFYLALLYSKSRSGFVGLWIGLTFFFAMSFWMQRNRISNFIRPVGGSNFKLFDIGIYWYLLVVLVFIGSITFVVGSPFEQLNKFTFSNLYSRLFSKPYTLNPIPSPGPVLETGGTESGEIRKIVWQGALDIVQNYPLFGSGVETFAYSYYLYRPLQHNLTSEWDFLYNKAHNEYLNYLATTGIFGLGSYLLIIGVFFFRVIPNLVRDLNTIKDKTLKQVQGDKEKILILALIAAYLSILVGNFFGFSVVVINLYFFLIPAFMFVLAGLLSPQKIFVYPIKKTTFSIVNFQLSTQWLNVLLILLISYFLILNLVFFWLADKDYASGLSLDRAGQYEKGYKDLFEAVRKRADEPTFKDELAINTASLATAFYTQDDATTSGQFTNQAIILSNQIVKAHPNNVTLWKSRARLFYTLSVMDEAYLANTIAALERAQKLAPTDPKITYNLALLYQQTDKQEQAIKTLQKTIELKANFRDAHYALGLFYDDRQDRQKAITQMEYIIKNIATDDGGATQKLLEWRGY